MAGWTPAGGKLRELGADSLTDSELLAILTFMGVKSVSAQWNSRHWLCRPLCDRVRGTRCPGGACYLIAVLNATVGDRPPIKPEQARGQWARGKVRAIGRLRAMVREMLAEELTEVDELVDAMLRGD